VPLGQYVLETARLIVAVNLSARRLRVDRDCAGTFRRRSGRTVSARGSVRGAVRHRLTLWPTFTLSRLHPHSTWLSRRLMSEPMLRPRSAFSCRLGSSPLISRAGAF